jgi:predicted DNA-binding transcriptional regulator AlpA
MTPNAKHREFLVHEPLNKAYMRAVDQFSRLVTQRIEALAPVGDRSRFVALTEQALREAHALLDNAPSGVPGMLPVSRLKASDVISQGLVDLSQATLYRAVEAGRFYCTTPKGRSIGKEFPAWQFVEPVPELIEPILTHLVEHPSSEIHAFWVTAVDELNELSPAEVLAGKPFETRTDLHPSQQTMLALPVNVRVRKVEAVARYPRSMADIVG